MKIFVSVKQLGRKKPPIGERIFDISETGSLRALICAIVAHEVEAYNARTADDANGDATHVVTLMCALTGAEIEERAEAGKVSFGLRYNEKIQNAEAAAQTALQAFEDGLYRIFHNDDELTSLDAPLALREHDRLTFIRLTMLAGRLW